MKSDIEIAQSAKMLPVSEIAGRLGILPDELEPYGRYKAKLAESIYSRLADKPDGKLVLVTAINPTPAGGGQDHHHGRLGQAMRSSAKRQLSRCANPSLGPVFGIKGGAAGGGYAQVVPMETSTCISPVTCMLSPLQTTCSAQFWTTISSRATS